MSIHRRLLLGLLFSLVTLFALSGGLLYFHVRTVLLRQFDAALAAKAHAISGLVKRESDGQIEIEFSPESMPEFGPRGPDFFQVRTGDGSILAQSPSLGESDLPTVARASGRPALANVVLSTGRPGRLIALETSPVREEDDEGNRPRQAAESAAAETVHVVVAQDRSELDRTMAVLLSSILLIAALLGLGTVAVVTVTVRRGLRPLDRVASEAARIDARSLAFRFSLDRLPAELRPICLRLNESLQRLEEAFARERRFTADVAHELRTPIAELRSLADVALKWDGDPETSLVYFKDAQQIAQQMEAMVSALLCLARCQSGTLTLSRERVVLGDLIQEAWERHEAQAAEKALTAAFDVPAHVALDTDRTILAAIAGNLLSNAVQYTPPGKTLACRAEQDGEWISLSITNDCAFLAPDDLSHLFEPFWRKDAARTDGSHCGLGLTLVEAYASSLGGKVEASTPRPGSLSITLSLPLSFPADSGPDGSRDKPSRLR